jgi:cell division protein FtsA
LNRTILAIDIGSTKITAIVAEISKDDTIHVIGTGKSKAQGIKKGVYTNIDQASRSIKAALNDAKRVAGTTFERATVSMSGAYAKSVSSSGIVNIPNKEISLKDIGRVMQSALYNANIPNEYEVLHVLPYNFKVDEQDFIEDPLGMNASRLEVETHVITTQKSNLNNLRKAVKATGIEIENIVLNGYASAIAVLSDDEKDLGACVIDMGGNSCNLVVHSGNSIRYNDFLAVGSNHVTNDLSMALHTPVTMANKVKKEHGSLHTPSNDLIELPVIGDEDSTHEVSLDVVHNVIYARVEETLMILAQSLEKSNLKDTIGAGLILTGGFTKLPGIRELAIAIFDNMPVRIGKPAQIDGLFDTMLDPVNATAIGLVLYGADRYTRYEIDTSRQMRHPTENKKNKSDISLENIAQQNSTKESFEPSDEQTRETEQKPTAMPNSEFVQLGGQGGQNDESNIFSKMKQWASQLF